MDRPSVTHEIRYRLQISFADNVVARRRPLGILG